MSGIPFKLVVRVIAVVAAISALEARAQDIYVDLRPGERTVQLTRPQLVARVTILGRTDGGGLICRMPSAEAALQSFVARYPTPEQASSQIATIQQRLAQWSGSMATDWTDLTLLLNSTLFSIEGAPRPNGLSGTGISILNDASASSSWDALDRGDTVNLTRLSACLTSGNFRGWVNQALSVLRQYYGLPAQ